MDQRISSIAKPDDGTLGGRLRLLDPMSLEVEQRAFYDRVCANQLPRAQKAGFEMQLPGGELIGPFNALLRAPGISGAFMDWEHPQGEQSGLDEEIRQVIILTVGALWRADYELYAHTAVGRTAGWSSAAMDAIKRADVPKDTSLAAIAVYRLVDAVVRTYDVPDDVYNNAISMLGAKGVVAALQLAGQYMTVSAILKTFRIPAPQVS